MVERSVAGKVVWKAVLMESMSAGKKESPLAA